MTVKPQSLQLIYRNHFCVVLLLFLGCYFLSTVIPPLKSPDEHDHIERAYLLGKGVFVLNQPERQSSGRDVDTGLLKYLNSYLPFQNKMSAEAVSTASDIRWSGQRIFDPSPGTGYYFPAIYLPQTLGLLVGEWLDLTVDQSYRLSRASALIALGMS